jgi:hypothetical protein
MIDVFQVGCADELFLTIMLFNRGNCIAFAAFAQFFLQTCQIVSVAETPTHELATKISWPREAKADMSFVIYAAKKISYFYASTSAEAQYVYSFLEIEILLRSLLIEPLPAYVSVSQGVVRH